MFLPLKCRHLLTLTLSAMLLTAVCDGLVPISAQAASEPPRVKTEYGEVIGLTLGQSAVFRGIPYAKPPTGSLRWQPPLPPEPWPAPLDASAYGPSCPQSGLGVAPASMSEDCLTLNIAAPVGAGPNAGLPVMVWIHGGAFRAGSSSAALYSNNGVWNEGGVVLVTLNYRLGPLGFFAHPLVTQPGAPANFGLLDMVAALQWIGSNIAAFGGDPQRVTIFGESAGGMAVHMLMVTPAAEGLFSGAIAQSGYGTWPLPRSIQVAKRKGAPSAEALAEALVQRLELAEPITLKALKVVPAASLVAALQGFQLPIVDGVTLPDEPGQLFRQGRQHAVPFITGANSFDGSVMEYTAINPQSWLEGFGDALPRLKQLYRDDFAASPQQGAFRIFGDRRYLFSARALAREMHRVGRAGYLYYYDYVPAMLGTQTPGAPHASELPLMFAAQMAGINNIANNDPLGKLMRQHWIQFAKTGDPNADHLPPWTAANSQGEYWMVFAKNSHMQKHILKDKLDLFEVLWSRGWANENHDR